MEAGFTTLPGADRYRLLNGFVGPRLIAPNPDGTNNAAQLSLFNVFSHDPPLLAPGIQPRRDGRATGTRANLRRTGRFAVKLVALVPGRATCAKTVAPGGDDLAMAGLTPVAGTQIGVCSIAGRACVMECRVERCPDWPKPTLANGAALHMRLHADTCIVADHPFDLKLPLLPEEGRGCASLRPRCRGAVAGHARARGGNSHAAR